MRPSVVMESSYFCEYQIFGDSHTVRFCTNILNLKATKNEDGCAEIGISTSGQKIQDLTKKIMKHKEKIGKKVLIWIGTNDVKYLTSFQTFRTQLLTLKCLLQDKDVVFLTIAPLVKYWNDPDRCLKTSIFNKTIKQLESDSFRVLDLHQFLMNDNGKPKVEFFEKCYTRPLSLRHLPERVDLIHINISGMHAIAQWLEEYLTSSY